MEPITLTVSAGEHTRTNCPVWMDLAPGVPTHGNLVLKKSSGTVVPCQVLAGSPQQICFILDHLDKGAVETLTLSVGDSPATSGVVLSDVAGEKVDVTIAGQRFTSYHYASKWVRPFLLPIIGPYGDPITRRYPIEDIAGEKQDHPHHKSCWVAWGDVNGSDQWSELEGHGRQVHQSFRLVQSGPVFGRIVALNHWMTESGKKVLEEERTITFYNVPESGRLVDLTVMFKATEEAVRFGDTKEGGLVSIRVATSMDGVGDGVIVNAYGGTAEAETWGKRAHWCDYVGPVNGKTVGIAILDTPTNFRYPTYWHVRNYGLMTANPFGVSYFTDNPERDGSHTIAKGATFPFTYRLYFHAADTEEADVAGRFLDHVSPPNCAAK